MWHTLERNAYGVFMGKFEGRDHLEDLCVDGRIPIRILKTEYEGKLHGYTVHQ